MKPLKFNFKDAILFEDKDFILINKPPYLSTLEDRNEKVNVLSLARDYEENAQVGHRLDKDTSGVLAIARNPEAYRHISMQFENREVKKVYHAIVDGIQNFDKTEVNMWIQKMSDGTVKLSKQGKPAQTFFTTSACFKDNTLVECQPVTGRMHQIRIHLSFLKAPISGDELYGGKSVFLSTLKRGFNLKKFTDEEPLMKRMALHSHSLEFSGLNGDKIAVMAPYPKDFQALLKQLSQNLR